jgi:uncharacterized membrane protein
MSIPRHRGRLAVLYVGIVVIVVVAVVVGIALMTNAPHPFGEVPVNVTTSPTSRLAADQPYVIAMNDVGGMGVSHNS